jgi:hypothetical protein
MRWADCCIFSVGWNVGSQRNVTVGDQSDGGLHAQINLRDGIIRGIGSHQRCKCPGNGTRCSRGCRGWRPGSRPNRRHRGRRHRSGYRNGQRGSWNFTASCSKCLHQLWPDNHDKPSAKKVRDGRGVPRIARCATEYLVALGGWTAHAFRCVDRHRPCSCAAAGALRLPRTGFLPAGIVPTVDPL